MKTLLTILAMFCLSMCVYEYIMCLETNPDNHLHGVIYWGILTLFNQNHLIYLKKNN